MDAEDLGGGDLPDHGVLVADAAAQRIIAGILPSVDLADEWHGRVAGERLAGEVRLSPIWAGGGGKMVISPGWV
jgi:hypothetical protein